MRTKLTLDHLQPVYSRVILPLKALLEGDFFDNYIKRGVFCVFTFFC
jgi:ribonuclease P/MRP protein subunit RPP40